MKKGYAASKNHFCCCLVTKWSKILVILPALLWKKNYILTALNDLSLRLICFQQVSLICDLTTKLWRKRISSQKQKIRKNQVRKSPKSDIKLACFDILWYIIKINQLFYFSSKMPTYLYFFAFCVPKCQPVWRPKHLQKRKQIVCPNLKLPSHCPKFQNWIAHQFWRKNWGFLV